jgi:hypothetical protein
VSGGGKKQVRLPLSRDNVSRNPIISGSDADFDGSRPGFRDDLAHHSDLISLGIPG